MLTTSRIANCQTDISVIDRVPRYLIAIFLGLGLFLSTNTIKAENRIILDDHFETSMIGENLEFWPDPGGDAALKDAQAAFMEGSFKRSKVEVLSLGVTRTINHWFHTSLEIAEKSNPMDPWQIIFEHDTADSVILYSVDEAGSIAMTQVNTYDSFYARDTISLVPVLNLPHTKPGKYELYIQVIHSGPAIFPIKLSRESDRLAINNIEYALLCFYYGAWLVMVLYNFFVYLGTRSKAYFYYVLYVINIGIFLGFVKGLGLAFIIPNEGEWNRFLINTFGITLFWATSNFIRSFLNTKSRTPRLDKLLFWLPIALLCSIPFAGTYFGAFILIITSPISIVLILTSTINVLLQKHKEAQLFLMGWICLIAGICYQAFAYMGQLPWTIYSSYAIHIGSFIEITLIALALAQKINTYKEQKDIAEKEAQQRLQEKNDALQGSNKLKDEFIATISHELRTPLNGIVGSIELANSNSEDITSHLDNALTSASNLETIIDDILMLSETLSGNSVVLRKKFNITEIMTKTVNSEKANAKRKNITLCLEKHNIQCENLVGDPHKIIRALSHLLSNAIKFSPMDSAVQIHFSTDSAIEDRINLTVTIKDNGIGISQERMDSIFKVFNQNDGSHRRLHGGLGIGLKLVSNITNLLDGKISIQSELNIGTQIEVVLPLAIAEESLDDKQQSKIEILKDIQKILVVEDNPVNQKILVTLLKQLGYAVDSANNGKFAVDKCELSQYDVIFMDCQMPEMDGFEATERIRDSSNGNRNSTIIAVTANATEKDRQQCFLVGMDDFIKKPIRKNIIIKVLNEHSA